ncbi:MAG: phosphotransferase family protein [Demequina sp.]|uniref:phosphotransferase family protein n=1 Tax=Demequina sp. TaxID=2050685 RepID=UPI003A8BF682
MQSRTKVEADARQLARAVSECLGDEVAPESFTPLTDGTYNAAYQVSLGTGRMAVAKVAPPDDAAILTYERGLMAAEVEFYRRAEGHLPGPTVLGVDFSRRFIDRDLLIMSCLQGEPLTRVGRSLNRTERSRVRTALGAAVAGLGRVTGVKFGYDRPGDALSADTWSAALSLMVEAVLQDGDTYGVHLPRSASRLPDLIARAAGELNRIVTPTLVHFDLWDGNVFVANGPHGRQFEGVIDGERTFWGDPLAEFVSTSLFKDPRKAIDVNAGYAAVTGAPPDFGDDGMLRLSLYRSYLDLIMLIEGAPRGYGGPEHAGVRALATYDLNRQVRTAARFVG